MVSTEAQSILRRKTAIGAKELEARAMSAAKAMRQSIAKIGKELFETPLSAIGVITELRKVDDISEVIQDGSLLCLLEGTNGKVGAAVISADIVGGLIQQQTMGKVGPPNGDTRPMTQTDASLCAPLIDALFERVAPMLEVEQERDDISGYSFGARFEDKRALGIALDMAEYFVVRLTLDLALGARQGEMSLLLPRAQPETESSEQEGQGPESNNAAAAQMNAIAMGLPAELTMVLCRLSLGLSELEKLTIGDVLKLPHNTFPETEITTGAGMTIGSGILGQVNGMRALRLKREPVHANHPRRRESDLLDLDLPEITALPSNETTKGRAAGENDDEPSVENSGAEIRALKTKSEQADDTIDKPPANMRNATQETGDDVLPELDDFPDLMDLQQEIQTG